MTTIKFNFVNKEDAKTFLESISGKDNIHYSRTNRVSKIKMNISKKEVKVLTSEAEPPQKLRL